MNKRITQATQNDKQISKSIKRFFTKFHISSALKAVNAYKRKGTPVTEAVDECINAYFDTYIIHRRKSLLSYSLYGV